MSLRCKEDAKRTFSPLTPALSPLRGEGEAQSGSWSQCAPKMASGLPVNRGDKRPSSPQPSPPSGEEREKSAMGGSWSQCALKMASELPGFMARGKSAFDGSSITWEAEYDWIFSLQTGFGFLRAEAPLRLRSPGWSDLCGRCPARSHQSARYLPGGRERCLSI